MERYVIEHFARRKSFYKQQLDVSGYERFREFLEKLDGNFTLLDVGCGPGSFLEGLDKHTKFCLVGVDICKPALTDVRKTVPNAMLVLASATDMPFKPSSFDVVAMISLLHHLVGPTRSISKDKTRKSLYQIAQVMKNGSVALVRELCTRSRMQSFIMHNATHLLAKLGMSIPLFGIHHGVIVSLYTPQELEALLQRSRLRIRVRQIKKIRPRAPRNLIPLYDIFLLCSRSSKHPLN